MKYLKASLAIFVATFIFSAIGVSAAGSYGIIGVDLPILKGETDKLGPASKTETGVQLYENGGNINKCTGNENGIKARVYSGVNGWSDYITITGKNQTGSWADNSKTNQVRAYNIAFKNNTSSPCKSTHSGLWYLNRSLYK